MWQGRWELIPGKALVEAVAAVEAEVVGQHMTIQAATEFGTDGAAPNATG